MATSEKYIENGRLQYKNRRYKVLNAPLSDEIRKRLETYQGEKKWINPSTPWKTKPLHWLLENGKLYLVKLYTDGLLEELMGSDKVFASWIDELKLFLKDKTICKTHDPKENYVEEHVILHLSFDKGIFLKEEIQTALFTSQERKDRIDRYPLYTTIRMDSNDFLIYLEDRMLTDKVGQDQLLPIYTDFIYQMIDEDDDICLDQADLKHVLQTGEVCVFASAKGRDIGEIVGALINSVTDENLLSPRGCLVHLTMHKKYPRKSVIKLIEEIDEGLMFDFEPLKPELKEPFYVGTRFVNDLPNDEVAIKMLVSI
jgi:hypothetical protein